MKYSEEELKNFTEDNNLLYVGYHYKNSQLYIEFECEKHKRIGIQKALLHDMMDKTKVCKGCNGRDRTTDEFKELIKDKHPKIQILGEYVAPKIKILCRCLVHDYEWETTPSNLLSGFGCPKCGRERTEKGRKLDLEAMKEKLIKKHPEIEFLSFPILSHDNVICKCTECGRIWEASYDNLTKPNCTGCPSCASSLSEKAISECLETWNIPYIQQKKFDDLKDIFGLPFDFYLPENNTLIEYDGEQHYRPRITNKEHDDALREFKRTQRHDRMKTRYCKKKGINLIRIPYWKQDDLEYALFDAFVKKGIIIED